MPLYHMRIEWKDNEGVEQQSPHLFCLAESEEIARKIFITEKPEATDGQTTSVIRGEGWKEECGPFNSKELFDAAQKAPIQKIVTLEAMYQFFPLDTEMHIIESGGW